MILNSLESIDRELAERIEKDDEFRREYTRFWAANEAASELRALRKKRKMTQTEVAIKAETGQSAISRIEKADYDGWTFKTLVTLAEVLRARLRITLEPLEDVLAGYRHDANPEAEIIATNHTGRNITDTQPLRGTSASDITQLTMPTTGLQSIAFQSATVQ